MSSNAREAEFVEVFVVSTWDEHQRQHEGRLTGADREAERRAHALVDSGPQVAHLFPAQARIDAEAQTRTTAKPRIGRA